MGIAFLAGLISILTPATLLMTIFLSVAFSHLKKSGKSTLNLIVFFCLLTLVIYPLYGKLIFYLLDKNVSDFWIVDVCNYFLYTMSLVFGIWLTGIPKSLFFKGKNHNTQFFLILFILALVFSFVSYKSAGPIVGSILIENQSAHLMPANVLEYHFDSFLKLLFFTIGMLIPICFLIVLLQKLLRKLESKAYWEFVVFLIGIVFIAFFIIEQLM